MAVVPKPETPCLILVGGWNANILLNPDWLSKYLFPGQDNLELELPFGPSFPGPPRVSTRDIRLALAGPRLSFTPLNFGTELLDSIGELGTKIADYLPHTPIVAIGINFAFNIEPDAELETPCPTVAPWPIEESLREFGDITEQVHKYTIQTDDGTLNLSVRQPSKGLPSYDFNFHHAVSSLASFKELIADRPIREYQFKARCILDAVMARHQEASGT